MGKIIQGLLKSLKLGEEEDVDDFEEDDFETIPTEKKTPVKAVTPVRAPERTFRKAEQKGDNTTETETRSSSYQSRSNTKNEMRRSVPMRSEISSSDICIFRPKRIEDSQEICDMLKGGRVVFVNFEDIDLDMGQRIMDFIGGAVYALNANIHQVSGYNFVIAPYDTEISGDFIDSITGGAFEVPFLAGSTNKNKEY